MNGLKLYFGYALMNIRGKMQYRGWPFLILSVMINTVISIAGVRILFMVFGDLGSWTAAHTLLVYGIAAFAFGLAEWFSRGFDAFPWHVRSGLFDKILLRPRSVFLQIMGDRFEFERSGKLIVGLTCIIMASASLNLSWNFTKILCAAGAVLGGYLIYTGVMIIFAAISFYTVGSISLVYTFTNHTLNFAQIPLHTMPGAIKYALTFIFPIALCYYYPVLYIVGNETNVLSFLAFPVGILFFCLSLIVWGLCSKHYHSTGS